MYFVCQEWKAINKQLLVYMLWNRLWIKTFFSFCWWQYLTQMEANNRLLITEYVMTYLCCSGVARHSGRGGLRLGPLKGPLYDKLHRKSFGSLSREPGSGGKCPPPPLLATSLMCCESVKYDLFFIRDHQRLLTQVRWIIVKHRFTVIDESR